MKFSSCTEISWDDHPGVTQGILIKTGMEYRGNRDDLVRPRDAPMGLLSYLLVQPWDRSKLSRGPVHTHYITF